MTRPGFLLFMTLLLAGCFTVDLELPPRAYFGELPRASGESARSLDHEEQKNWFLAGLVAYSDFGVDDMLAPAAGTTRVEKLDIETRFSELDTLIWVFPGQVYGYYFWAPRTIHVRGREVRGE